MTEHNLGVHVKGEAIKIHSNFEISFEVCWNNSNIMNPGMGNVNKNLSQI